MFKVEIYFTAIVLVSLLALFAHQYIFSIYEVEYKISSRVLYLNSDANIELTAVPVNSFGMRAPFRKCYTNFSIVQGKELIEIVELDADKGTLVIRAKSEPGIVVIRAKSKFSLLPTEFEIRILPNVA